MHLALDFWTGTRNAELSSKMVLDPHILVGRYGRVAVLELGSNIVEHAHPQAQGLIKIDGPDRTILVAGRRHVLRDDTMVLLWPWIPHGGLASEGATTRVLAMNLHLPYESQLRARVRKVVFAGDVVQCEIAADGIVLTVESQTASAAGTHPAAGEEITAAWLPADTLVFAAR